MNQPEPNSILTVLTNLANSTPSHENLKQLTGSVATTVSSLGENVAHAYILAAAKQLPAVFPSSASTMGTWIPSLGETGLGLKVTSKEIVETVGNCIAKYPSPEQIVQSNIIPVLCSFQKGPELTTSHVEFLQACVYAKEYAFAENEIQSTWPTPRKGFAPSSQLVLRYFYLRGMVHTGTRNYAWAERCFWTCLCVPCSSSLVVSAITIAAWKKMVLIQCLQEDMYTPKTRLELPRHPKDLAPGLMQYITDASRRVSSGKSASQSASAIVIEESMTDQDNTARTDFPFHGVSHYQSLVGAFASTDRTAFNKVVGEATNLFSNDGTEGLVQRVDSVLLRRQIYQIGSIFSTISLTQFVTELGLLDPQPLLQQLSEEKSWPVRIENGWVFFPSSLPSAHPPPVVAATQNDVQLLRLRLQLLKASSPKHAGGRKMESIDFMVPPHDFEDI